MNIEDIQVKSFKYYSDSGVNNLGKKLIKIKCIDCGEIKEVRRDKFLCGSVSKCICHQLTAENMIGRRINDFIVYSKSVRNNRPAFLLKCIHCGELINIERYKIEANKGIPKCVCERYKGRIVNNHRCDSLIGTYLNDRHLYISEKVRMKDGRIGLKLVCTKCGKSFEASSYSVFNNQCGYCECDERYKWNTIEGTLKKYSKYVNTKINNLYIHSVYRDEKGVYRFICDCTCGAENISIMALRLSKGNIFSCPSCKRSFGESIIENYLKSLNITFKSEVSFNDLRGKRNMPYRFDFGIYSKDNKLLGLIEFDGLQHKSKNSISHFIGSENEEDIQKFLDSYTYRDYKKSKYCIEKGIDLLRIEYTRSKKKIEKEVYNYLIKIGGI